MPRRAKSDFLSVVQQLKWLQRLFVSRPKQSPGPAGLAVQPIRNSGNFSSWSGRRKMESRLSMPRTTICKYRPELLKHSKRVLSVGHDEYWSAGCAIILKEFIQRLETGLSSAGTCAAGRFVTRAAAARNSAVRIPSSDTNARVARSSGARECRTPRARMARPRTLRFSPPLRQDGR
jgi:hypothetical protein